MPVFRNFRFQAFQEGANSVQNRQIKAWAETATYTMLFNELEFPIFNVEISKLPKLLARIFEQRATTYSVTRRYLLISHVEVIKLY